MASTTPSNETQLQQPPSTSYYFWRWVCIAMMLGFSLLFAFLASRATAGGPTGKVVFASAASLTFFVVGAWFAYDHWTYQNRRLDSTELALVMQYSWNAAGLKALAEVCRWQKTIRLRHVFKVLAAHRQETTRVEELARTRMEVQLYSKFSPPDMER